MDIFNQGWSKIINYILDKIPWTTVFNRIGLILLIVIGTILLIRFGHRLIENIFRMRLASPLKVSIKREETLEKLLKNILTYVLYFISFTMILDQINIPIRTLLAGAGIVGLAVGFGAQNLVRDVITGFFIIFENQFSVGDYIKTNQVEGMVEEIGLRITKIKSWTGELHILPNSSINQVTNYSVNNSVAVVDISIAYEEDIDRVESVIKDEVEKVAMEHEEFITPPEVLGVQTLGSSEMVIRIVAEVLPMTHFQSSRILRKAIKQRLTHEHIEIPYPRIVTLNNRQKESM